MYCWNNTFINIIITLYEHNVVDYYCCNLKTICFRFLSTQRTLGKLNYKVTIHNTDHNLLLISIVDIILLSILLLHYMNILLLTIIFVFIKETYWNRNYSLRRVMCIFREDSPQYDESDLNKSQKTRPKTPTASKVIPLGFRITIVWNPTNSSIS